MTGSPQSIAAERVVINEPVRIDSALSHVQKLEDQVAVAQEQLAIVQEQLFTLRTQLQSSSTETNLTSPLQLRDSSSSWTGSGSSDRDEIRKRRVHHFAGGGANN